MKKNLAQIVLNLTVIFILSFLMPYANGASLDELKIQLEDRGLQIEEIEKEIEQYKQEIEKTGAKAATLNNELKRIDTTIYKLNADARVTERRIEFSELNIEKLDLEIEKIESNIFSDREALAELLRSINDTSSKSLLEILLANVSLSAFFDDMQYRNDLQDVLQTKLQDLRRQKTLAGDEKQSREKEKQGLLSLKNELNDRKNIEQSVRDDRSYILKLTKNEEKKYQELLDARVKMKTALEDEIKRIEEEIRVTIDPFSLPPEGHGVLGYPLPGVSLESCYSGGDGFKNCVTQFFGNTAFATANSQIYNGKGHNGIDFRATTGTPVLASREGVIRAIGNTDIGCRGVSYGKWILIDHPNNLSTLYAHLSKISVSAGASVGQGDRIAYSGSTGYATGPHLHFTVYATQAVMVDSYRSKVCGTLMELPLSPYNGYLNPLSYL